MAKIRMPLTNMKRKLPNIFLGVCISLVIIFVLNTFHGLYSTTGVTEIESGVADGRRLANYGASFGKRRRGRKRFDDDDDDGVVCKVPKLNIKTDTNRFAFYKMPPLNCTGESLFYIHNGRLLVNETVLKGKKIRKCEYYPVEWRSDEYYMFSQPIIRKQEPFAIKVDHDFFKVECYLDNNNNRRKLLSAEQIRHPNHVGSVGMPDPVFIQSADPFVQKSTNQSNKVKNAQSVKMKTLKPAVETTTAYSDDERFREEMIRMHQMEYDARHEYYNNDNFEPSLADFEQFFAQVVVKEEITERLQDTKPMKNSLQMNILIIAMDSMSHLSYQRKLPKTYKYLKEMLGSVILNGYNIVGDATTAAILPIMTGKSETELPEVRRGKIDSTFVDAFPLIWNKYEQSGYVTLYSEDQPGFGTFQLRFNGFEEKPVDHYMRPFWQSAIESRVHKDSDSYCLGNKPEHQYQLNYVKQFFEEYKDKPKFAFNFHGELSHADNNPAEYIDSDLVELLAHLSNSKALDNTLLIVMGDHGARYSKVRKTVQGKLEERLPMMSFTFPTWFGKKYSKYYNNLKQNADRLTTPFDIHETLRDVLDITRAEIPVRYNDRGISLLHEIPANRTCSSAHIDVHWCTCMKYEEVDIGHQYVVHGAKIMVEKINSLLSNHQDKCERLRLKEIADAKMIIPNEKLLKYLRSIDSDQRVANFSHNINFDIVSYQIILTTTPNDGLYEGTVHLNIRESLWQITPSISRINAYGNQPKCILKTNPELRKYCYCRDQIKNS